MQLEEIYIEMLALRVINEKMEQSDREWLTKNLDVLKQKKSTFPPGADHTLIDRHIANHEKAIASIDQKD